MNEQVKRYLVCSAFIDFDHPLVAKKATEFSDGCQTDAAIAKRCFEFVRDSILHSWDYRRDPVTCRASDVLLHGTGYCYSKSHLLTALLRANNIPAGLCYQRLAVEKQGPPFCLHGMVAVYLKEYGWYRMDARGNRADISCEFSPPIERLAFRPMNVHEKDFHEIWPEPLPIIVHVLTECKTIEQVYQNLPDIEVIKG